MKIKRIECIGMKKLPIDTNRVLYIDIWMMNGKKEVQKTNFWL